MVVEAGGLPHRATWAPSRHSGKTGLLWSLEGCLELLLLLQLNASGAGINKCLMWLLLLVDPALNIARSVSDSGMLPIKITSSHLTVDSSSSK